MALLVMNRAPLICAWLQKLNPVNQVVTEDQVFREVAVRVSRLKQSLPRPIQAPDTIRFERRQAGWFERVAICVAIVLQVYLLGRLEASPLRLEPTPHRSWARTACGEVIRPSFEQWSTEDVLQRRVACGRLQFVVLLRTIGPKGLSTRSLRAR